MADAKSDTISALPSVDPTGLTFRTWRSRDVEALCRHANNRKVWSNLLDRFPHPYTKRDAERWIDLNHATLSAPLNFAIEREGEAIGGVGVDRRTDIRSGTGEIGYWVAEPFWGQGIAMPSGPSLSSACRPRSSIPTRPRPGCWRRPAMSWKAACAGPTPRTVG
jgi:hypothetical protein